MFAGNVSKRLFFLLLSVLLIIHIGCANADTNYVTKGDDCTATLQDISSSNGIIYITYIFKNNSSTKKCFTF